MNLELTCLRRKYIFRGLYFLLFFSCKTQPNSDRRSDSESRIYHLRLNPPNGAKFHYDIVNESEFKVDAEQKKVDKLSRTELGIDYQIDRDSIGDFVMHLQYDKIHIHTKAEEGETDLNAGNPDAALDPTQKMLNSLLKGRITAVVNGKGNIKEVKGFDEMAATFISDVQIPDPNARKMIRQQWDKMVGEQLVNQNMKELFKIFPDSAVHVGDKWGMDDNRTGEIPLHVKNLFTLKSIDDGIAYIKSEGEIRSDSSVSRVMGYEATSDMQGHQEGEYKMDTKTGMLVSAKVEARIEGNIQVMGRNIPVKIETSVKLDRK